MKEAPQDTARITQANGSDQSSLLVLPPRVIDETAAGRHIVPREVLEPGDAIEIINRNIRLDSSWQSPLTTVVTLISTAPGARVEVVTLHGKRRTVELDQFYSVTLWPGSTYQISSQGEGDIIRMQKSLPAVQRLTKNEPPPTSGYSICFPSPSPTGDGPIEILSPSILPGFEVKLLEGLTDEKPHHHHTFDTAYFNIEGALTITLTAHSTGEADTFDVPVGGCVVIPRHVVHHVIGGSPNNRLLVFSWPRLNGHRGND